MSNRQKGGKGNDVLIGGDRADEEYHDNIRGLQGNDYLSGGLSRDNLQGGAGDDTLIGGPGDDVLGGNVGHSDKPHNVKQGYGPGADTFIFNAGDGHDVIVDFEVGVDKIVFWGASLEFTVKFGLPESGESDPKHPFHWGVEKYGLKDEPGIYTTITYDGGKLELLGIAAHSLDELNGT